MAEVQKERDARFKKVIDDACVNGGKVRIAFAPNGIRQVRDLMRHFVEHGIVTLPTQQEIDLRRRMDSGDAEGCVVEASFAADFKRRRGNFEREILPGVTELALVEKPPPM